MFPTPRPEVADLSVLLEPVRGTGRPAARGRRPPLQADSRAAPTSLPHQLSIREAVEVGVVFVRESGHMSGHVLIYTPRAFYSIRSLSWSLQRAGKQAGAGTQACACHL